MSTRQTKKSSSTKHRVPAKRTSQAKKAYRSMPEIRRTFYPDAEREISPQAHGERLDRGILGNDRAAGAL